MSDTQLDGPSLDLQSWVCPHTPSCPAASAPDRDAAIAVASHPEQGWDLLCNGAVRFGDTGGLLPNGQAVAPHRVTDLAAVGRNPGYEQAIGMPGT